MTQLQIVNLALSHLGMNTLADLAGTDPATTAANLFFEPCRDDVFREYKWPFATVQELLAESAEDALLGWSFMYDYPTQNVATVWTVFNEVTTAAKEQQRFQVYYMPDEAKRVICSDLQTAYAEYTYLVSDITMWDAKFIMALSYRLAASMAHDLLGDPQVGLQLTNVYNNVLSEAKRVSFSERNRKPDQTSGYVDSRG